MNKNLKNLLKGLGIAGVTIGGLAGVAAIAAPAAVAPFFSGLGSGISTMLGASGLGAAGVFLGTAITVTMKVGYISIMP
jgi:hypothetical protein